MSNTIYEQPLNEHTRVCLRTEHLLKQADFFLHDNNIHSSHACLSSIIDLLNVLDRPDLRNRFAKEFTRYQNNLLRIEQSPNVDHFRLQRIIQDLQYILDKLHSNNGRFAQNLRENEFLNNLRLHLNNPGGICLFDTPFYQLWLHQTYEKRFHILKAWLSEFSEIHDIIEIFLHLTRDSSLPAVITAQKGFFQCSLDPQVPFQLIRVSVKNDKIQYFPQISVGRYGVSIRFFIVANNDGQYTPTDDDVSFEFTRCVF